MDSIGVGSPDRFAGYTHNHLAHAIGLLDTKVSIILSITTGAIVYLVQSFSIYESILEIVTLRQNATLGLFEIFAIAAGLCLGVSFLASLLSIMPRFGPSSGNIVYYGGISKLRSAEDFVSHITVLEADELTKAVLRDAYFLAKIAKRKAVLARYASYLIAVGLPLLISAAIARSVTP